MGAAVAVLFTGFRARRVQLHLWHGSEALARAEQAAVEGRVGCRPLHQQPSEPSSPAHASFIAFPTSCYSQMLMDIILSGQYNFSVDVQYNGSGKRALVRGAAGQQGSGFACCVICCD